MDNSRLLCIRKFIKEAKEFINSNNVPLGPLVEVLDSSAAMDFNQISCSKSEINLFFSTLWELMSCANAPHWNCICVLGKAVKNPNCKQLLVKTFRFVPILADLLLKSKLSSEKQIKLLYLLEHLSHGIKIDWHEPYLSDLIKTLYKWITNNNDENEEMQKVGAASLSTLVNLCYKNATVTNLLVETIDSRILIKHLVNKKTSGGESIQVCRLLLIIQSIHGVSPASDVHNYLGVAMRTLSQSIKDVKKYELIYINMLIHDLCADPLTKIHVLSYDHFEAALLEALKNVPMLLAVLDDNCKQCLQIIFTMLQTLVQLELFSLRSCHKMIVDLCVKTSSFPDMMSATYCLLAIIILQYEDEGMLPDDVASSISVGLHNLLDPANLDIKSAGLDWLRFICALNDCHAMRESILHNVNVEKFEEIVKQILQNPNSNNSEQETVLIACYVSLSLVKRSPVWETCFHHILSNLSVQRILRDCISIVSNSRRKHFLQILKHADFPTNRINEVFFRENSSEYNKTVEHLNNSDSQNVLSTDVNNQSVAANSTLPIQQVEKVEEILKKVNNVLERNEIQSIPMSNIIELYLYKILSVEHRLNISNTSLQSANQAVTQLNHSLAMLQTTNKCQEDILLQTQIYNEKLEGNVVRLSEQMGDAEKTIKKFQSKLAAEKLDREQQAANAHWEYTQKIKDLEASLEVRNEEWNNLNLQFESLNVSKNSLEEKLNEQTKKNNELAGVLVKFEDRVKQKEKKLEEANQNLDNMRLDLECSQQTVKTLEKTLMEREKRLTQVTSQLEEMHRIQDMIANLMSNKASANVTNNSMN